MKKLIAYRRVSTTDQKIAGNGLEAQSRDIDSFAAAKGYSILLIIVRTCLGNMA